MNKIIGIVLIKNQNLKADELSNYTAKKLGLYDVTAREAVSGYTDVEAEQLLSESYEGDY